MGKILFNETLPLLLLYFVFLLPVAYFIYMLIFLDFNLFALLLFSLFVVVSPLLRAIGSPGLLIFPFLFVVAVVCVSIIDRKYVRVLLCCLAFILWTIYGVYCLNDIY